VNLMGLLPFFIISASETSIDTVTNGYCLVKCDAVIRWSLLTCHVSTEAECIYSSTLP